MSKLLFDSQPLVVDPDLAVVIGLNEAIILQQLHYWIIINQKAGKNFKDGYYWTYNSFEGWKEQFPFWSIDTIKRTITKLKNKHLITVDRFNKHKRDRTNWYKINYEVLESLKIKEKSHKCNMHQCKSAICTNGSGQFAPMDQGNLHQPLPETIKENKRDLNLSYINKENKPADPRYFMPDIKKLLE